MSSVSNYAHAVDGAITLLFHFAHGWRHATVRRWATEREIRSDQTKALRCPGVLTVCSNVCGAARADQSHQILSTESAPPRRLISEDRFYFLWYKALVCLAAAQTMAEFPRGAPSAFLDGLARVGDDQREHRHVAPAW